MPPVTPLPTPPLDLLEDDVRVCAPALDLEAWVRAELLALDRPLTNHDHEHLFAEDHGGHGPRIGFLWCAEVFRKKGMRVLGQAQLGEPSGGNAWAVARQRQQLAEWFGDVPDFLVTLDALRWAHEVAQARPANVLATLEHELYHCWQDRKADGDLRFDRDGLPIWGIRPHPVEEFPGVVFRYGADASGEGVRELVSAAVHADRYGPAVSAADLAGCCGTCLRRVA